jgi:hypothetical protein
MVRNKQTKEGRERRCGFDAFLRAVLAGLLVRFEVELILRFVLAVGLISGVPRDTAAK